MLEKIRNILVNYTETDLESIVGETDLQKDLGLNSFDVINIIVDFEDTFGIEIPDEDVRQFVTVNSIIEYLDGKGCI